MTKTADEQRFPIVGAPRFELGTSSPPGLSDAMASDAGKWREVPIRRRFPQSQAASSACLRERLAERLGTEWAQVTAREPISRRDAVIPIG